MKSRLLGVLFVALALSSCSKKENSVAPADNAANVTAMSKKACLPFTGSMYYHFATNFNLNCACGSAFQAGNFFGTGTLSHLGASTSKFEPCVTPIFAGNTQVGLHVTKVCGSFVAANGDELYCISHPYDLFFTNTGAVGVSHIDFAGGTGRFEEATGSIVGMVVNDNFGNSNFTNIVGTISY